MKKRIFFKTVRSTGDSCWVNGALNRNYKIGERYTFPDKLPAHGFVDSQQTYRSYCGEFGLTEAYRYRREAPAGNRVLICFGTGRRKEVKTIQLNFFPAAMELSVKSIVPAEHLFGRTRIFASTDFEVIGEVFCPKDELREEDAKEGRMPTFVD